jgi:hypothetical protein
VGPFASGAPVTVSTTVRVVGVLTNPGGITLQVRYPDGTSMTGVPSPTTDGTGLFHVDLSALSLNQLGRYRFAWVTTGTAAGVQSGGFDIIDVFAPVHISLDEVYEHLELTGKVLADAKVSELQRMLNSAVAEQEQRVGPVAPRTVTESVYAHHGRLALSTRPVMSVTSATLGGVAVSTTAWLVPSAMAGLVDLGSGAWWGSGGPSFSGQLYAVTYTVGRNPVPADLQEAALLRVQHSYETQRGSADTAFSDQIEGAGGSAFLLILRAQDKEKPYVLPAVA